MIVAMVAFLQAVSTPPDIELRATVRARSLTIEKQGDARVSVTGNGRNLVDVEAPPANGRKTIRNPEIKVNIEARIADPLTGQADTPNE